MGGRGGSSGMSARKNNGSNNTSGKTSGQESRGRTEQERKLGTARYVLDRQENPPARGYNRNVTIDAGENGVAHIGNVGGVTMHDAVKARGLNYSNSDFMARIEKPNGKTLEVVYGRYQWSTPEQAWERLKKRVRSELKL